MEISRTSDPNKSAGWQISLISEFWIEGQLWILCSDGFTLPVLSFRSWILWSALVSADVRMFDIVIGIKPQYSSNMLPSLQILQNRQSQSHLPMRCYLQFLTHPDQVPNLQYNKFNIGEGLQNPNVVRPHFWKDAWEQWWKWFLLKIKPSCWPECTNITLESLLCIPIRDHNSSQSSSSATGKVKPYIICRSFFGMRNLSDATNWKHQRNSIAIND